MESSAVKQILMICLKKLECTPSAFADDTELGGRVDLQRDLDWLHPWAGASGVRFSQVMCWALHLGHNPAVLKFGETIWEAALSCLVEKDLVGVVNSS